jgi:pilus assembly protein CpaC
MRTGIQTRIVPAVVCALAAYAVLAVVLPVPANADSASGMQTLSEPQAAQLAVRHLTLSVGKSTIVESPVSIQRISIAAPDVVEALAVSPKELLINGKKDGETSLIMWEQGGNRLQFDILVTPSMSRVDAVRRQLKEELEGQDVDLVFENNTPFLRGTVKNLIAADRAVTIATTLGKPVNLLHVTTPPPQTQILLKVKFADVDRQAENEFGFSFFRNSGGSGTSGAISTSQFSPTTVQQPSGGGNTTSFSLSNALNLFIYNQSINLGALINMLQAKNMAQLLAEPNLLAIDGKAASFLAGGEFPYPTVSSGAQGGSQVSIAFHKYGVSIDFVPHITARGTIRLEVTPEVSSLDFANGLTYQGYTIPAFDTRRVQTEVELENGQSFAIGGLMDNRTTEGLNKIPGLGSIPFFGKLFQSRTTTKNKTELLVLVTAEIVRPIPADQKPPELNFPESFLSEGATTPPHTPGMDQTGPVPVTPPSATTEVETLVEEKKRDKVQGAPQQPQLMGAPTNSASPDVIAPGSNGSGNSSSASPASGPGGAGK